MDQLLKIRDPASTGADWSIRETLAGTAPFTILLVVGRLADASNSSVRLSSTARVWSTIIGVLLNAAILLVPVYWIVLRRHCVGLAGLGFKRTQNWHVGASVGLAFFSLIQTYVWIKFVKLRPTTIYFGTGIRGYVLAMFVGCIFAPFTEEVFFRGFLFPGLRTYLSFPAAAAITSIIFGFGHSGIWPQTVDGLCLAWLRERSNSLWPCIALHAAINAMLFTAGFVLTRRF